MSPFWALHYRRLHRMPRSPSRVSKLTQYKAPTVRQKVGSVVFDVPNFKKAEKHHVKVGDIKSNQYTGSKQTSCDFNQGRGNGKGMCSAAP